MIPDEMFLSDTSLPSDASCKEGRAPEILLADDERHDRFFFRKALEELDPMPRLTEVRDGSELIDYLLLHPDYVPTVIFIDLSMPRMGGRECLIELKKDARLCRLPIVIYSTSTCEVDMAMLHREGAHYYMDKSSFSKLSHCIGEILCLLSASPAQPPMDGFLVTYCDKPA